MLVLTRKAQEEILIGDSIRISIVRIQGNAVRLGIEAPRDVRVVRAELPPHEVAAKQETTGTASSAAAPVERIEIEASLELDEDDHAADADRVTPALRNERVRTVLRAMLAGSRPA